MHELGLARSIAAIVAEHAGTRPVAQVRVALGPLACVERSALDFCWGIVTEGTALSGADLIFLPAEADTFLVRDFTYLEEPPCAEPVAAATSGR